MDVADEGVDGGGLHGVTRDIGGHDLGAEAEDVRAGKFLHVYFCWHVVFPWPRPLAWNPQNTRPSQQAPARGSRERKTIADND